MPIYLALYKPNIFKSLKGKFLNFVDFYSIFEGIKQPTYSIEYITNSLTGRHHKGEATQDALDLYECYKRMQ